MKSGSLDPAFHRSQMQITIFKVFFFLKKALGKCHAFANMTSRKFNQEDFLTLSLTNIFATRNFLWLY